MKTNSFQDLLLLERLNLAYHNKLNPRIFDNRIIRPLVREKLLEIGRAWQKFSRIGDDQVKDIILTGGNCAFNYTRKSDLDVHIVINKNKFNNDRNLVDLFFDAKKSQWASAHNNRVMGYPVELYCQDIADHLVAAGVYSLLNNRWIIEPHHEKLSFTNDQNLLKLIDDYKKEINSLLTNTPTLAKLKAMKERLKNLRKQGLENGGEFSLENLTFKELRNSGFLGRLNDSQAEIVDKDLSL